MLTAYFILRNRQVLKLIGDVKFFVLFHFVATQSNQNKNEIDRLIEAQSIE